MKPKQLAAGAGGAGKGAGKGAGARIRGIGGEGAEGAESGWTIAVASGDREEETWTYICIPSNNLISLLLKQTCTQWNISGGLLGV